MKDRNGRRYRAFFEDGSAFSFYNKEQAESGYCHKDNSRNPSFCFDGVVCGYYEFEDKMFILTKDCKDPTLFFAGLLDVNLRFREMTQQEFPVGSILSVTMLNKAENDSSNNMYTFEVKKSSLNTSNGGEISFSTDFPKDVITLLQGLDFSCIFSGHIVKAFVSGPIVDNTTDKIVDTTICATVNDGIKHSTFIINNGRDRLLYYPQSEKSSDSYEASIYRGFIIGTPERYFSVITPLNNEIGEYTYNKILMKKVKECERQKKF